MADSLQGVPTFLQPDFLIVPGKFFAYMGPLQILLAAGDVYFQKREEWDNSEQVNLLGQPKVLALTGGDHAIAILLFFVTSWISGAGPRSANIMNYMTGVEFGPVIWSSLMHPASSEPPAEKGDSGISLC